MAKELEDRGPNGPIRPQPGPGLGGTNHGNCGTQGGVSPQVPRQPGQQGPYGPGGR